MIIKKFQTQKGRKMEINKRENNKVSLNIKIEKELNFRLKRARKLARKNKEMFNVSEIVSKFLNEELLKFEEKHNIKAEKPNKNQRTIFEITS